MARQDLYKDIQAYKDYYQGVMDASGEMPSGTDAEEMLDQLHNAQEGIAAVHGRKKSKRKVRRSGAAQICHGVSVTALTIGKEGESVLPADDSATSTAWPPEQSCAGEPDNTSGIAPESDWAWTGLDMFPPARGPNDSTPGSTQFSAAASSATTSPPLSNEPPQAPIESASEQKKQKRPVSPAAANIPRLGVDDSGDWRFILMPRPRATLRAEGWRLVDLIYESSDSYHENDHGFEFRYGFCAWLLGTLTTSSSGSEWEMYSNQQIYFYPVSKVARIDGKLWRCAPCSEVGEYRIVEDLGEVTRPEWDGVGYSKD